MPHPLCFVLMPFGRKPAPSGLQIDFDMVYSELIAPAIAAAKLDPLRADEEVVGGIIHKPMFERLILCDYAVADLTTANANVFYELGVRHAVKSASTALIFADGVGPMPFDVGPLRGMPYKLSTDGKPSQVDTDREELANKLIKARKRATDSPIYQLVEHFPDIARLSTDVFRDRVTYSMQFKDRFAAVRQKVKDGKQSPTEAAHELQSIEAELADSKNGLDDVEAGVLIDLFLSYRAVKGWNEMITLVARMGKPLNATVMVQEQYGLALNRAGRGADAERVLRTLLDERGPSSETYGILGRVYKDRWSAALEEKQTALAAGLLDQAIDTYLKGFESDWRDAYPGVNAATLMELREPPDPRRKKLLSIVKYAAERRIASNAADYWDYATLLEIAVLSGDRKAADIALKGALPRVRELWEPASTLGNLRLIFDAQRRRGELPPWTENIERELTKAKEASKG